MTAVTCRTGSGSTIALSADAITELRVRSGAYGSNYERRAGIKSKYDPTHLFRHNQNITPAA